MPGPRVSVVIPLHNHRDWVLDAVRSVGAQGYPGAQVVVVNNGSTDGSARAVMDAMSASGGVWPGDYAGGRMCVGVLGDTPTFLLDYPDAKGPSFARNRGIEVALKLQGADYVGFLDSDDRYEPGKLAKSVAAFESAQGTIGAVYSDYDTVRPDGVRVREYKPPFSRAHLLRECIVNCDSLVSRAAIEAVGLFDEELRVAEDYDYWLRLSERFLIHHIPESLVTIRVGGHSSTATVPSETWARCHRRVFQKLAERVNGT